MEICPCRICIQESLPLQEHCEGRKLHHRLKDALPGTVVLSDRRKDVLGTTCLSCKVEKCEDRRMETAHSRYVCRGKYKHPRAEENPSVPQAWDLPSDSSSPSASIYFFSDFRSTCHTAQAEALPITAHYSAGSSPPPPAAPLAPELPGVSKRLLHSCHDFSILSELKSQQRVPLH